MKDFRKASGIGDWPGRQLLEGMVSKAPVVGFVYAKALDCMNISRISPDPWVHL
jgi:hypothetical protein